jgi:uncharacterized membrane protein YjjP (DUF1212 family)
MSTLCAFYCFVTLIIIANKMRYENLIVAIVGLVSGIFILNRGGKDLDGWFVIIASLTWLISFFKDNSIRHKKVYTVLQLTNIILMIIIGILLLLIVTCQ